MKSKIKKAVKSNYSSKDSKSAKVDCGFYGAKDLQPHLRKIVKSTGGYTHA